MWLTEFPFALSILFLLAFTAPVYMLARLFSSAVDEKRRMMIGVVLIILSVFYLSYVSIACFNGLFAENTLPPRILQLSTLPLIFVLLVLVFNMPFYKRINATLTTEALVRVHIFRLIGSFFLILAFYRQLPAVFACVAGIGDLITAIGSIYVAKQIKLKGTKAKTLVLVWNTFGLLDILATSSMAFAFTRLAIETGQQGVEALGAFPFCFIPAFAPPVILFLHLSVYRKVLVKKYADT
ncbi:MAG: hypothetical protein MUC87_13715 [Bacteroidia bacterium]|jgi:hypothetical protein|nr:hypothetical protein [Bacteroidia bacterium]